MKSIITIWMCCALAIQLLAQPEPKSIESRHYFMKDGLSDEQIFSLVQDSIGFLWLGTGSGLNKFDGYSFTSYQNDPTSTNSLANNEINTLWQDDLGRLWIGHAEGLDIFDPRTETFLFHWFGPHNQAQGSNINIRKILSRKDGKVWICSNHGLFVANPSTLQIEKYSKLPDDVIYFDVTESADGSIWLATFSHLMHFDPKTEQIINTYVNDPNNNRSISNSQIRKVFFDQENQMWVGTHRGLNLFNAAKNEFTQYLTGLDILNIYDSPDGKLWLATEYGAGDFDPKTGRGARFTGPNYTWAIVKDRQDILWFLTLHGLHQVNPKRKKFKTYLQFDKNVVYAVEDRNRDIWVSTFRGVFRFDQGMGNIYQYIKSKQGLSNLVLSMYADTRGHIWFASNDKIERLNLATGMSDSIHINNSLSPIAMLIDSHENIWLGNYTHISKYDFKTRTLDSLKSFPKTAAHFIIEDSYQNIWMATSVGLIRYNLNNKKLDVFKNNPNDPQSLSNNIVYHILIDDSGTMWVGTDGGLNKVVPGTENDIPKFQHWLTSNSNLPHNNVYQILDGKDGTLWMICGNFISHFFTNENTFRNYVNKEGLPENFTEAGSLTRYVNDEGLPGRDMKEGYMYGRGLRSSSGKMYFGTGKGLIVFHPDSLQDNPYVPPIAITNFSINNRLVPIKGTPDDSSSVTSLSQNISYTRDITLTHAENDFSIEFAALNFVEPENNLYKYKLEPFESEWIQTTASDRIARYTNINPGKYTFRVIGSNNDGLWNEEGATLVIIITPPWWKTWWAYTLYALSLVGIFLYWRNYENKRLKLKHRAEHLSELDNLKTRFFTNISHEFRTPITLIQGPLKEMYKKAADEEERSVIDIMLRNARRLSRLINQLLDLSKLEAGKMKLHANQVELVQFLREIAASYESIADDKRIKYFFYPEATELRAYIDAEKIEKVVHNLLSNALKFTKEGGEIILYLKQDGNHCSIMVKDTGIGIPADQLDKIFDRFYQVDSSQTREHEGTGLGMALAKELVELHHGTISVESLEGKGTTFTVKLPLGREHLSKDEIIEPQDFKNSEIVYDDFILTNNGENEKSTVISGDDQPILMIVEDNADMRHYIRKTFYDQYQIIEAANGKEGIKKAEEAIPDLIISDVMMPEMDGYKFCEHIKTNELTSHIPVILLTAKADRESKLTGLETGADDYLSKPFDADELKLIVKNRIDQRKKVRERFSREVTLEPKQISITSFDEKFLNKVMTIIEDHIGNEHFSIDELSREVGYSNMHFYRKLKALTGETPSQFLRTIRLKRAAELLRKKSDNVTQIAYSVGFSSLSYFNKCFKEQFGVTPGQFEEVNPNTKVKDS